mgnify:FL=1
MKKKNDPFAGIKITPHSGKQTIIYNYQPGVKIRVTLNATRAAGYLSRGTIGLLDPQTGHLLQIRTDSKSHRFSDAATLELYIPCPRQGETQEQVIRCTVLKRAADLIKKYRSSLDIGLRSGKSLGDMSLRTAIELYATDYVIDESSSVELRKTYYNQLNKMAAAFEDKKLTDLTSGDFKRFCTSHPRKNGLEYVKRLYRFLATVARQEGVVCPAQKVLADYIRRQERDPKITNRRLQREAAALHQDVKAMEHTIGKTLQEQQEELHPLNHK